MPTLYVTNHSSRTLHGPGRRLTIMAAPRAWEHGDGRVSSLVPALSDLREVQRGQLGFDAYRQRFMAEVELSHLRPGTLWIDQGGEEWDGLHPRPNRYVQDGDTLCCACSREAAGRGECHRVWAAELLRQAGWRVVLDGVELP